MRLFDGGLGCSVRRCSAQATSFQKATWSLPCLLHVVPNTPSSRGGWPFTTRAAALCQTSVLGPRGTGCHSTLPRNSAAVLAARALVPNSIDDGVGAFEHKARTLGEAELLLYVAAR